MLFNARLAYHFFLFLLNKKETCLIDLFWYGSVNIIGELLLKGKVQYSSPPCLEYFLLIMKTLFTYLQNKLP
jgi:hypothetical protein